MDVKKDVELQKQKAQSNEVHKDFFTTRDKSKRGTAGLVEDSSEILSAEAEVKEMLYKASLKECPLPEGTEPMFNTMFLTARRNKLTNESGLYLPTASFGAAGSTDLEQDFAVVQKVMSVGPHCQQVCKGMEVKINVENFKRRVEGGMNRQVEAKFEYEMPLVVINDVEYIRISERDVDYIVDTKGVKKDDV
tara:strand:+ start:16593 stop:17168 length:576 start_codon:yes stop_codon:yes gene_type:complete